MSLTSADVKKIARLSRIKLRDDKEIELYKRELNSVLGLIDQLQGVDTDGVEPLASVVPSQLPIREDVVNDGDIKDEVLANAPESKYGCFVVPKVVE